MMKRKIDETIKKYNMLSVGDTVVVGVSGGADSVLLLKYFISVKQEYSLNIVVAHIEHGIRGKASLDDADFVKKLCNDNDIKFVQKTIDAVNEAKAAGLGVEEYSRNVRYDFFNSIKCDKIATAHNLSDVCETLLFRLSRGTSLKGICAIPPVRGKIIRPLIEVSGDEIRSYCKENGIQYKVDATNSDNDYSRNYIRNVIIPNFERLNPSFENAVCRFADSARADEELLNEIANKAFDKAYLKEDNSLSIDYLKSLSDSEIRRVIVKFFDYNNVNIDELHIKNVISLLYKNGKEQIKGNIFAVSNDEKIVLKAISKARKENKFYSVQESVLNIEEFLNIRELYNKNVDFYCDYDKIDGKVIVRSRNVGDLISPAGRGCTKTLKKLYNEYKIPCDKRDDVAVICDDTSVIGIVGYCCDERVKVTKNTKNVYIVKIHPEDN